MSENGKRHVPVINKNEVAAREGFGLRSFVIVAVPLGLLMLGGALLFWPSPAKKSLPDSDGAKKIEAPVELPPLEDRQVENEAKTDVFSREPPHGGPTLKPEKQIENHRADDALGVPEDEGFERRDDLKPDENSGSLEDMFPQDIDNGMPEGTWPRGGLLTLPSVKPELPWKPLDEGKALTRIAVGSCLSQRKPQPIWDDVLALSPRPNLFLMIGDNVYGDIKSEDYGELIQAYRTQGRHVDFARARSSFPFLATWDDHDFGRNDAGAAFPHKAASAKLFRDFWQIDTGRSEGEGIFYSKMVGPAGQRVHIVMLDTRSFRSALTRKTNNAPFWGRYQPSVDVANTMLGQEQWAWFQNELKRPADLRLIVSSVQVLSNGHGFERWRNFPREFDRLMRAITVSRDVPTVLLSGDRHFGAVYEAVLSRGRVGVEVTTSSLNRSYGPSKDIVGGALVSELFHRENFAVIDIDWERLVVSLSLHGLGGEIFHATNYRFSQLGGRGARTGRDAR